jgi:hypothetical protein
MDNRRRNSTREKALDYARGIVKPADMDNQYYVQSEEDIEDDGNYSYQYNNHNSLADLKHDKDGNFAYELEKIKAMFS